MDLKYILLVALLVTISNISKASQELDLPVAKIFQVDSNNRILRPWTNIDRNFETVIERVESLRLDCTANHPVQWIYTGSGIPAMISTNKYSRINTHGETTTEYTATTFINPLKEYHTGKYQCSPTEYIDFRTFFYIYVPGQSLFTSMNGRNILLPKNDTNILIPCTVSNPKATVTLERSERDILRKVKVRSSDAVTYDPKEGFRLKLDQINDPEGTYVCTAKYGSTVRTVEYTLKSRFYETPSSDAPANLKGCSKSCGENAFCDIVNGKETCKCQPEFKGNPDLKCVIKCDAHTDCPSTMSCFVDRLCRNPCIHSQVGCGVNAKCRTENHRPVCYCPPDYVGDETVQCFNTLQGAESEFTPSSTTKPKPSLSTPSRPSDAPPKPPRVIECKSNTECDSTEICLRTSASSSVKKCVKPCLTRRCGRNAICQTEDHRTSCVCIEGYTGDARIECGPLKLERNQTMAYAEPLQSDQPRFIDTRRPCAKPEECGPDSECKMDKSGKQLCLCKEGYNGQPPKCRAECRANKDCAEGHVCLKDSRVTYPACAKVCGTRVCGAHADCVEYDGTSECYCPPGFNGDPLVKCETAAVHLARDCVIDYDCGVKLRCETGVDYRKCVDPCEKKECSREFECVVEDHVASCKCPKGYTGNSFVGCTKDNELNNSTVLESECIKLSCGPNSECNLVDGKPKCFCQAGYIGKPPACITECFTNSQCPSDLTCIQRRCRHQCSGCGKNTKCRVSPTFDRAAICSCLDGFEGNPNVECTPKRS